MRPDATLYLALHMPHFQAQVIAAWQPELAQKPFAVVQQETDSHKSVVFACSPVAQKLGLETGTPLPVARKRFPGVHMVLRNPAWEETSLKEINRIIDTYSPDFTLDSRGNAVIDLTHAPLRRNAPAQAAEALLREIRFKTGLSGACAALSRSRFTAALLSRRADPGQVRVCAPGYEEAELAPLPIGLLPGLSPQARRKLLDYALRTIGQAQALAPGFLRERFGAEGDYLYGLVHGIDEAKARPREPGVVKSETVLSRDINDRARLAALVRYTADKLCHALRGQGLKAGRLSCLLRYSDDKRAQKSRPCPDETADFNAISATAQSLFTELYSRRVALRSITLSVTRPARETGQMALFESPADKKQKAIADSLSRVRGRMGFDAVINAACLEKVS
jgi:DNA polymerase-4